MQRPLGHLLKDMRMNIATPGLPGVTTVVPLGAWEGAQCDDILWLLRIGHLKEGWWEDNPSHLSDQRKDYWYAFSFPYFLHSFFLPLVGQLSDRTKNKRPRVSVY